MTDQSELGDPQPDPKEIRLPNSPEELKGLLDEARLEGARLVGNTANHILNNQLNTPLGFADMIAEEPNIPDHLKQLAQMSIEDIVKARRALHQLLNLKRLVISPSERGNLVLNLDQSTQLEPPNPPTLEHR